MATLAVVDMLVLPLGPVFPKLPGPFFFYPQSAPDDHYGEENGEWKERIFTPRYSLRSFAIIIMCQFWFSAFLHQILMNIEMYRSISIAIWLAGFAHITLVQIFVPFLILSLVRVVFSRDIWQQTWWHLLGDPLYARTNHNPDKPIHLIYY